MINKKIVHPPWLVAHETIVCFPFCVPLTGAMDRHTIKAANKLAAGHQTVKVDFNYNGGGPGKGATIVLSVNGNKVSKTKIERSVFSRFSLGETWDVGEDKEPHLTSMCTMCHSSLRVN